MKTRVLGMVALALPLAATQALAQQAVYRCGQTYQQAPCAAGEGRAVDVDDSRTAQQRQGAHSAATAEGRQARELAAERRAREKAAVPQTAPMGISAPRPDEAASAADSKAGKRKKKKKSKTDDENPRYWSAPAKSK